MKDVTSSRAGSDGGFRESGLRPEDLASGVPAPPRSYWPARIAVLVAMALYLVLPDRLVPGPRVIVPALEAVVLVAITVLVPHRTTVAAPARRVLAILIIGLVTLANIINLALLLAQLLKGTVQNGRELVVSSVAIWLTNAIST